MLGRWFGGLYGTGMAIGLVNRDNFFLSTPILNEVTASDLELAMIVNPLRKQLRMMQLFSGDGKHADLAQNQLT